MSRGGARPGAGRKKGTKILEKIFDREEKAKIQEMLSHGLKAKAKIYSDYLNRVKKGEKVSLTEKKLMDKVESELKSQISNKIEKNLEETPLEYMLRVMNDPNVDEDMRSRMAQAAAPFCHVRRGEGIGKKEEQRERVEKLTGGKYMASRPPLKAVK